MYKKLSEGLYQKKKKNVGKSFGNKKYEENFRVNTLPHSAIFFFLKKLGRGKYTNPPGLRILACVFKINFRLSFFFLFLLRLFVAVTIVLLLFFLLRVSLRQQPIWCVHPHLGGGGTYSSTSTTLVVHLTSHTSSFFCCLMIVLMMMDRPCYGRSARHRRWAPCIHRCDCIAHSIRRPIQVWGWLRVVVVVVVFQFVDI